MFIWGAPLGGAYWILAEKKLFFKLKKGNLGFAFCQGGGGPPPLEGVVFVDFLKKGFWEWGFFPVGGGFFYKRQKKKIGKKFYFYCGPTPHLKGGPKKKNFALF